MPSEASALVSTTTAASLNDSVQNMNKKRFEGPFSFKTLCFLGGIGMAIANLFSISADLIAFAYESVVLDIYLSLFGILIIIIEMPAMCSFLVARIRGPILHNAKFLEYTWGRGLLYLFCGILQISGGALQDWIVGGYMVWMGIMALWSSYAAHRDMRLLKVSLKNEDTLKTMWHKHDTDGNGFLDFQELTNFIEDAGVDMSKNQVAAAMFALDKDYDGRLSFDELIEWWIADGSKKTAKPEGPAGDIA